MEKLNLGGERSFFIAFSYFTHFELEFSNFWYYHCGVIFTFEQFISFYIYISWLYLYHYSCPIIINHNFWSLLWYNYSMAWCDYHSNNALILFWNYCSNTISFLSHFCADKIAYFLFSWSDIMFTLRSLTILSIYYSNTLCSDINRVLIMLWY